MLLAKKKKKKIEFIFTWRVGGGGGLYVRTNTNPRITCKILQFAYRSWDHDVSLSLISFFFLCFFSIMNTPEGVAHTGICLHVFI